MLSDLCELPLAGGVLERGRLAENSPEMASSEMASSEMVSPRSVMLLRPMEFMNRSGGPTLEVARRFDLSPSRILAVFDDLDLPLGRLRVRRGGGSGGHNGVSDLIDRLAELGLDPSDDSASDQDPDPFPRIRLGIGKPTEGEIESHVLGRFTDEERPVADAMVARAVQAVVCWFLQGIGPTMNEFNRDAPAPPAPTPEE